MPASHARYQTSKETVFALGTVAGVTIGAFVLCALVGLARGWTLGEVFPFFMFAGMELLAGVIAWRCEKNLVEPTSRR